jgi:hypothetical protein
MKSHGLRLPCLLFPLILICPAAFAQPAPDAAAFDALMTRVKTSAMRYQGHLPDFTCTELTVRKESSGGRVQTGARSTLWKNWSRSHPAGRFRKRS